MSKDSKVSKQVAPKSIHSEIPKSLQKPTPKVVTKEDSQTKNPSKLSMINIESIPMVYSEHEVVDESFLNQPKETHPEEESYSDDGDFEEFSVRKLNESEEFSN